MGMSQLANPQKRVRDSNIISPGFPKRQYQIPISLKWASKLGEISE